MLKYFLHNDGDMYFHRGACERVLINISVIEPTCIERRLEPEFERDRLGARRLVAPRPASRLFSRDGERAHMNAWNEDTVNTPSLFSVLFVPRDTCVSSDCDKACFRGDNCSRHGI